MVEIKRTRGQSFTSRRIGVVNVTTDRAKVREANAELLGDVADTGFRIAAQMQQTEAAEYLKTINTLDDNGDLTVTEIPKGLGRFGRAAVQEELSKQYAISWEAELRKELPALKQRSGNDTAALKKNIDDYLNKRYELIKASGGEGDLPNLRTIANQLGAATINGLRLENIKREEEFNRVNLDGVLLSANKTIFTHAVSSDIDSAKKSLAETELKIKESIYHTPTQKESLLKEAKKNYNLGITSLAKQKLNVDQLVIAASELNQGKLSKATLKLAPELAELEVDAATYEQAAADFSKQKNLINDLQKRQTAFAQSVENARNGSASQEDMDAIFASTELSGQEKDDIIALNQNMPSIVVDRMEASFSFRNTDPNQLQAAVTEFAKHRKVTTGEGDVFRSMGLDDATLYKGDRLVAAFENGENLIEVVQRLNVAMDDIDFTKHVQTNMLGSDYKPTKTDNPFSMINKFTAKYLPDEKPSVLKEMDLLLYEAIKTSDSPSQVKKIFYKQKGQLYKKSKYFEDGVESRYAPEVVVTRSADGKENYSELMTSKSRTVFNFDSKFEYENDFEKSVDFTLHNRGYTDKSITKDVVLRPVNHLSDQTRGVYYLIDKDSGDLLQDSMGPIMYKTDRLTAAKKQIEMIRSVEKKRRQQKATKKQRDYEESDVRLARDIAQSTDVNVPLP